MGRITTDGNAYAFRSEGGQPTLTEAAVEEMEEVEADEVLVTVETDSISQYRVRLRDWLENGEQCGEGYTLGEEQLRQHATVQSHEEPPTDLLRNPLTRHTTKYRCEECMTIYDDMPEAEACCGGGAI